MAMMERHGRALAAILLAAIALLVFACEGATQRSEECLPGDFEAVKLADGGPGFLRCNNEGGAYVPYDGSNPNTPGDSALPDAGEDAAPRCSTANGQKLGFMCPGCVTNADCESNDCFSFPNKGGNLCTYPCTSANAAAVCVPPYSAGCGNNGNCKPTGGSTGGGTGAGGGS
jgi:hypothetical protein